MRTRENCSRGLGKTLYRMLILGEPDNASAQERRDAFLLEFKDRPDAEALRIRFRILVLLLAFVPYLAFPASVILVNMDEKYSDPMGWPMLVNLLATLLPNFDNMYVRAVMKRRCASQQGHHQGYPRRFDPAHLLTQ